MTKDPLRSFARSGRLLVLGALVLLAGCAASATPLRLSGDLGSRNASDQVDVIVQYRQAPTLLQHQRLVQRGATMKLEFQSLNARAYRVSPSALAELEADPNVLYVSLDRAVHSTAVSSPAPLLDYHADATNASAAWSEGLDGSGIGVAVIDSGIDDIPDLHGAKYGIVYSQDFVPSPVRYAGDQYGHGSHVAGIIAGNGSRSTGWNYSYTFKGIAPGVRLINLRVLDQNGQGTDSQVIAAIDTAIRLKNIFNIRVINLSVGRGVFESYKFDPLCRAVEQAWANGIVVVVAAGNEGRNNSLGTDGYGTITAPGNDPYVITVGAMNTMGTADRTDDVPTSYTSRGPTLGDHIVKPDVVAPGNRTISLYATNEVLARELPGNAVPKYAFTKNSNDGRSDTYFYLSGTSMAAPMVSGAAALLLEKKPSMTPDQVKARIMKTAFKNLIPAAVTVDPTTGVTYNLQADIFTVGAGYLDIKAALSSNDLVPAWMGSAMSPTAALDRGGHVVLVPNGASLLGTTSAAWSAPSVFGQSVLWGTNLSGLSILWGTYTLAGQSILWGTNVDSAASILWGTSVLWGTNSTGQGISGQGDLF